MSAARASYAKYLTRGIDTLATLLGDAQEIAGRQGLRELRITILDLLIALLADVNAVAVSLASAADQAIIAAIAASHTARRPLLGQMETHIRSVAGPFGLVYVALIEELDKIVNPRGFGTFWRAQEYGTGVSTFGGEIPSQIGRPLAGIFEPSMTPPDRSQRGLGVGRDLAFLPGRPGATSGSISVDLPARHFLADGSAQAGAQYVETMSAVLAVWERRILALVAEVPQRPRGKRYLIEI